MVCDYKPADMRFRVTLQAVSRAADGQGGFTETWVDQATLWAGIKPKKSWEKFQAQQLQTPTIHAVTLRYRAGVTTAMRLLYGTRILQIKEVIKVDELNIYLQLTCVETT